MNRNADHLMLADIPFWFIENTIDGERVYPDIDIGKSWRALPHGYIKKVGLQFRDHIEIVTPEFAPAYFFIRSIGMWHIGMNPDHYFIIGWQEGDILKCGKWKMPEIQLMGFTDREITERERQSMI